MSLQTNIQALILGKQGSGKSLLARTMLSEYVLQDARSYYIGISTKEDHYYPPEGEWELYLERLGFNYVPITPKIIQGEIDLCTLIQSSPKVLFTLQGPSPLELEWFMEQLGQTVLDIGHTVLLVDEADRLIPRKRPAPSMLDLVRRGRWNSVDLIMVSHSDTSIHPEVFENSNMLVAFGMKHPTRVERLKYYLDDPSILTELKQYEYCCVDEPSNKTFISLSTDDFSRLKERRPDLFGKT